MLIPFLIFILFLIDSIKSTTIVGILISLLGLIYLLHLILLTYYIISSKTLRIKSSFFYDKTIDIMTIKKVSEVFDIFSSPTASMKRLLIKYNDNDSVAISPNDKSNFIKDLKEINQAIEFNLKD